MRRRAGAFVAVSVVVTLMWFPAVGSAAVGSFSDDDGSVHESDVEAIALEGITAGCNPPANDQFCPEDPVTRGQMATFLVCALDLGAGGS